jgi:hypothetical protein
MKNELNDLDFENFIKQCDENYDVVFSETIDLVNRWKKINDRKQRTIFN